MIGEINNILAGALIYEKRLEVLSNNIANVNTTGFKEDKVFRLPIQSKSVWDNIPEKLQENISVDRISSLPIGSFTNFNQGQLKQTGNVLDIALDGEGFFAIQTPKGIQYTRKGNFALNQDGTVVTQDGFEVLGKSGGSIQISGHHVIVDHAGVIHVDGTEIDSFNIVDFPDKKILLKVGDSLYSPINQDYQGVQAENIVLHQGFTESSNVDPVKVMTEMINVMRGYESYQKVLMSMNDNSTKTVNEVGKIS